MLEWTNMIDLKNILLIVGVLVVVSFFGLYIPYVQYRQQERGAPVLAPVDGPLEQIVYTNKGFEPEFRTVQTGTTVEWVNASNKLMWVASDDHPSHTKLPGFDQKGPEGNVFLPQSLVPVAYAHAGVEIFRYTFLEKGVWEYHNHLAPMDMGTVVVE